MAQAHRNVVMQCDWFAESYGQLLFSVLAKRGSFGLCLFGRPEKWQQLAAKDSFTLGRK